jgi:hypothetical protein
MSGNSDDVVLWIFIEEEPLAERIDVGVGARAKMSEGWASGMVWSVRYCLDLWLLAMRMNSTSRKVADHDGGLSYVCAEMAKSSAMKPYVAQSQDVKRESQRRQPKLRENAMSPAHHPHQANKPNTRPSRLTANHAAPPLQLPPYNSPCH